MNFIFLITIIILIITKIKCEQLGYVCSKSFFIENHISETINCVTEEFNLTFQCRIKSDQKIRNRIYDSILSNLNIKQNKNDLSNISSTFTWKKIHHKQSISLGEKNITLTKESNNYFAELILYKISYETAYEICTKVPNINIMDLCCRIKNVEPEEEPIYMPLIVIVIVFIINFVVVIVFWKCPPSAFHSLDEMLEKLPTSHVKKLKKLLLEGQDDDKSSEKEKIDKNRNFIDINTKNRRMKISKNITFNNEINNFNAKDNPAFEEDSETGDIEHYLRFEAQKIRRLSRISLDSIELDPNDSSKPIKKKLGVKFADQNKEIILDKNNEVKHFRKKIIDENKRRASIKPYKKAFNLDISSESSDYSD
jgi:hypothetical protein